MDVHTYLKRIEYPHELTPNLKTLQALHLAHMLTVPFENLDIDLKRPIRIDMQSLWRKIIVNNRGGFCYELNGMFGWLLMQIGYEVTHLNARVFNQQGQIGIEFDHLALLVECPGSPKRWLVDVGFGDSFTQPLNFEERGEQEQGLRAYRIEEVSGGFVTRQRQYEGTWERLYFFDIQPHKFPEEYEEGCLYHQTSPNSTFTQWSIISRATEDGRISLEDGTLIVTRNGKRDQRRLDSAQEYAGVLMEHFGIDLQKEIA